MNIKECLKKETDGLTFDNALNQWAEVTTWSGTTPCLTHPDTCGSGASVTAWVKLPADCPGWGGIFGSQGNAGTSTEDTEGLVVCCQSGGTGLK